PLEASHFLRARSGARLRTGCLTRALDDDPRAAECDGALCEPAPGNLRMGNAAVTYVLITILFALLYGLLPDVKIPWRDVWVGAVVTSLLLSLGKWAIGYYLGNSEISSAYGTAASMIVLLFWVYYASLLVLLGAVFTRVYSQHFHEHRRRAVEGARRVRTVEKEI